MNFLYIVSTSPLRWNQSGITIAGITGARGTNNDQLDKPFYVTVDYQNSIYVADSSNNRIQKFTRDSLNGTTVCGTGVSGSTATQLFGPLHVLVDSSGNLRVTDGKNQRIQLFNSGVTSGIPIAGNG